MTSIDLYEKLFLSDPDAKFSKSIGWADEASGRTGRYAIVIDHGKVSYAQIETERGVVKVCNLTLCFRSFWWLTTQFVCRNPVLMRFLLPFKYMNYRIPSDHFKFNSKCHLEACFFVKHGSSYGGTQGAASITTYLRSESVYFVKNDSIIPIQNLN